MWMCVRVDENLNFFSEKIMSDNSGKIVVLYSSSCTSILHWLSYLSPIQCSSFLFSWVFQYIQIRYSTNCYCLSCMFRSMSILFLFHPLICLACSYFLILSVREVLICMCIIHSPIFVIWISVCRSNECWNRNTFEYAYWFQWRKTDEW